MWEPVIRTQRIEIVGKDGEPRAIMGVASNDDVIITFHATTADPWGRAILKVTKEGIVGFRLNDSQGKGRVMIAVGEHGEPHMTLRDENGYIRAMMALTPDGEAEFAIRSGDGQIEFLAPPEPIEVVQN